MVVTTLGLKGKTTLMTFFCIISIVVAAFGLKGKTTSKCRDARPCVSTCRASLQIISDRIINSKFQSVIFHLGTSGGVDDLVQI